MSRNSFDININLKGFPRAHQELNKTKDGMERMRESTSGLRRQIGALRNNILLFSFAVGGAAIVVNKFVSAAAGFESVRTRLIGLTGSVEEGNKAFDRFNAIAGTTPFALQDVVNAGAQLEAFGVNSKATLSAVTDLAAFMNTTAVEAANALGRAFAGGVGAADILRDKGIRQIIQDSQGIEDITKLTLPEFRSALINALTDPDGRIAGSAKRLSKTYEGAVSNMKDAVVTFQSTIGEILLPTLTEAVISAEKFIRNFDKTRILQFGTALVIVSTLFTAYRIKVLLAAGANLKFAASLRKTAKGLAIMTSVAAVDWALQQVGVFEDMDESLADLNDELEKAKKEQEEYRKELEKSGKASVLLKEETDGITKSLKSKTMALTLELAKLDGANEMTLALLKTGGKLSKEDRAHIKTIMELTAEIDRLNEVNEKREEKNKEAVRLAEMSASAVRDNTDAFILYNTAMASDTESLKSNVERQKTRLDVINQIADATGLGTIAVGELKNNLDLQTASVDANTNALRLNDDTSIVLTEDQADLVNQIIMLANHEAALNEVFAENARLLKEKADATDIEKDKIREFKSILSQTTVGQIANIEATIAMIEANRELFATLGNVDLVLDKLKNDIDDINENIDDSDKSSTKAAASINILAGAMQGLKGGTKDAGQMFSAFLRTVGSLMALAPGGQAGGAIMNLLSGFVGHTGGLIKNDGIQRFAIGGMVQGQDNVPIIAQAGEFIIQKKAVKEIGIENLADINNLGKDSSALKQVFENIVQKEIIENIVQKETIENIVQKETIENIRDSSQDNNALEKVNELMNIVSMFTGHTGGLIKNNGIQRFATGGMVQGQDNVPIMAQAGEFIMRREAVQNIGVQNLADMNRTGQSGGVTINISAPLVDDTVIDHIIPAINKATNRDLA